MRASRLSGGSPKGGAPAIGVIKRKLSVTAIATFLGTSASAIECPLDDVLFRDAKSGSEFLGPVDGSARDEGPRIPKSEDL